MSQQGGPTARSTTIFAKDLNPWVPDIDPRRSDKPQIINGTNFIDDVDGPRSAFSSNFVNFNFFDAVTAQKINELRIGDFGILYGTITGVWAINPVSAVMECILPITVINTFWPWTIAYVGGVYYLAQYDIGLWQYDPVNNTMGHVSTPSGDVVRFVAASFGRLIGLSDVNIFVSALDDGTDLTPSLTTAAGAQPISIAGGTAWNITPIPDGFLVYTSNGIIKATYTTAAWVFEYKKLTEGVKLWSPNAAVYIPRLGAVSIDNSGFNLTREYNYQDYGTPQPWELLMGDFVKKNILQSLDQTKLGSVCLYYSQTEQKLFVSFSTNIHEGLMVQTFVYTIVNKKWGSFDHQTTGIFETYNPINNIYTCSYMGTDGYMRAFTDTDMSQDVPPSPATIPDYLYRTELEEQIVAFINDGGTPYQIGFTEILQSDNNPQAYANYTGFTSLFYINYLPYSDTMNDSQDDPAMVISNPILGGTYINMDGQGGIELIALPYQLPSVGINSILSIGPIRFTDENASDETSAISTLTLGLVASSLFTINEDWNAEQGSEDWNSQSGNEDWGLGTVIPNVFNLSLVSSNDSATPQLQGTEELQIFNQFGAASTYAPLGYSGIFHVLTLDCADPGQSYALKTVDVTGLMTGRLMNL